MGKVKGGGGRKIIQCLLDQLHYMVQKNASWVKEIKKTNEGLQDVLLKNDKN